MEASGCRQGLLQAFWRVLLAEDEEISTCHTWALTNTELLAWAVWRSPSMQSNDERKRADRLINCCGKVGTD